MLSTYINAWKVKDIRKKIIFVLMILAIFRLGSAIPMPGISLETLSLVRTMAGTGTLYSMIAGGGAASIFALGIGPYITSSIIMQLLTVAISPLEQLKKEGEEGRKKINQITRMLAVVLAIFQGIGTVLRLNMYFGYQNMFVYSVAVLSLVTGTMFVMWLAELVNEKGIGNGTSFIIFANILSGIPAGILGLQTSLLNQGSIGYLKLFILAIVFILIITFVVRIQGGERRIPIKYSKREGARQSYVSKEQYMPFKVNIAGVMSIIFALTILQFPSMIAPLFNSTFLYSVESFLNISNLSGAIVYVILIFFFTFFYTSFAINPVEMADNMKKNASFIPGIRPGKPTVDYFDYTINKLSWIGSLLYSIIAVTPIVLQWIFGIEIGFGGTTLLIVTGVCLDLVKQMETQLLNRHYKGFLS